MTRNSNPPRRPTGVRALFAAGMASVLVAGLYLCLFIRSPDISFLKATASVMIDPGWRGTNLMIPEGIHAGVVFFVVSGILNWTFYAIIAFLILHFVQRR